MTKALVL